MLRLGGEVEAADALLALPWVAEAEQTWTAIDAIAGEGTVERDLLQVGVPKVVIEHCKLALWSSPLAAPIRPVGELSRSRRSRLA